MALVWAVRPGFAYTSSFTVTVWKDGAKRVYLCFIGAKGFPQCTVQPAEASDEADGVEIRLAVKRQDIEAFRTASQKILIGFRPRPRIINDGFRLKDPEIVLAGEDWVIYRDQHGPLARQGCVLYPIEAAKMRLSAYSPPTIYTLPIIVDFPMNSLQFTTSREALGYDDDTIAVISQRMEAIAADLTARCQAKIEALPSYAAACRYWVEHKDYTSDDKELWNRFGNKLSWRGRDLSSHVSAGQDKVRFHLLSQRTLEAANPFPQFIANTKTYTKSIISLSDLLVVLELPHLAKPRHRMRALLLPGFPKSQHILWVKAPDEASFKGFLSELADPPWVNLADYEPAALSRPSSAGRTWPTTSWRYGRKREAASLDPTEGGVYVLRVGDDAYGFAGRAIPTEEVGRIARLTIDAGLMGSNEPVWFFTQKHQSLLKTHQNWQALDEFIKERLSKVFDLARYLEVADLHKFLTDSETRYLKDLHLADPPQPIARFKRAVEAKLPARLPDHADLVDLYNLVEPAGLATTAFTPLGLWADLDALRTKWPLLPLLARADAEPALAEHYFTLQKDPSSCNTSPM